MGSFVAAFEGFNVKVGGEVGLELRLLLGIVEGKLDGIILGMIDGILKGVIDGLLVGKYDDEGRPLDK